MSERDAGLFRDIKSIVQHAHRKYIFEEVAKTNEMLRDARLTPEKIEIIYKELDEFIMWVSGDDSDYYTRNAYRLVKTPYGPRVMNDEEWGQYRRRKTDTL